MSVPRDVRLPEGSTAIHAFIWAWYFSEKDIGVQCKTDAGYQVYRLPFDITVRFLDDAGRVAVTVTVPPGDSYNGPRGLVNVETPPKGFIWRKE